MPFLVRWHTPAQTLVEVNYAPPHNATWEDYHAAMAKAHQMTSAQPHRIGLIVAAHDAPMPPGDGLDHISTELTRMSDNTAVVVSLVAGRLYERSVLHIMEEIDEARTPHITVTNWEGAYRVLKMFGLLPPEATPNDEETTV